MTEFIMKNLNDMQELNINIVILNNIVSLLLSFFIMFLYRITYSGAAYSRKFNVSLGMITLITTMIMSIISNNIALSLGMVGALSILRFRTAVKDVRDATFIFWCIAVGIGCGVSQYMLVAVSSATIVVFLVAMRQVSPDSKQLLIVQGKLQMQNKAEAAVESYFGRSAHRTMKNASSDSCELVYSISEGAIKKAQKKGMVDVIEILMKIDGVSHVNLVEQIDDIGR
ncbi:MAG TPA: DUF4956 domain-containing protein [Lachnospiraceae bacterium]|nr:DUF4956 domain-containing protein [Lachnospiraceae bacterium]